MYFVINAFILKVYNFVQIKYIGFAAGELELKEQGIILTLQFQEPSMNRIQMFAYIKQN